MAARRDPADTVEALLRTRANRGVFRSFAATPARGGKRRFTFVWLNERPLQLLVDPKNAVLEFRDLLPNAPAKSPLYRDLRRFLQGRMSEDLPAHRRIDAERLAPSCRNRAGSVSVLLHSVDGDLEYAVGRGLKLVNEIFLGFLRGPYYEYMVANFNEPED